jgi:hypothetical protein
LHVDPQAENGDVFAEEMQSVIELRKRSIDSEAVVRSNQLYWSRSRAFGWHEVKGAGKRYLSPNLTLTLTLTLALTLALALALALALGRSGLLARYGLCATGS